jgi:uncharacterized membrane protein
MTLLHVGLAMFILPHLLPTVPAARTALVERFGAQRYKAIFSLVSLAGFAAIVAGYAMSAPGPQWFTGNATARAVAPIAMVVSVILFAAANSPSHIRAIVKHPMLLGTLIWAGIHLLANGDARGSVLFAAFFLYALIDLVAAIAQKRVARFVPRIRADVISVVAGVILALVVMTFHRTLFGPAVVAFGY